MRSQSVERAAEHRARGEELPADLAKELEGVQPVLDLVRSLLGLDQLKAAISGAAPMPQEVLLFFRATGVPMSEIYGLSETSGPMTWTPFRVKPGTVGPPIPGEEVVLADDGEVLAAWLQHLPRLPQRLGAHGRGARRRRLAAHRRHR